MFIRTTGSHETTARALAGFILAIPLSLVLGAPLSGFLLRINWFGLARWRWVSILGTSGIVATGMPEG